MLEEWSCSRRNRRISITNRRFSRDTRSGCSVKPIEAPAGLSLWSGPALRGEDADRIAVEPKRITPATQAGQEMASLRGSRPTAAMGKLAAPGSTMAAQFPPVPGCDVDPQTRACAVQQADRPSVQQCCDPTTAGAGGGPAGPAASGRQLPGSLTQI
jgi:hypothetical protein